jgi:hypothetical protein
MVMLQYQANATFPYFGVWDWNAKVLLLIILSDDVVLEWYISDNERQPHHYYHRSSTMTMMVMTMIKEMGMRAVQVMREMMRNFPCC